MMRMGEVSPTMLASELEVTARSICKWCVAALEGEPSKLERDEVRRDYSGRLFIDEDAAKRLIAEKLGNSDG